MGIPGLWKYVATEKKKTTEGESILKPFPVYNTTLVIDGSNLWKTLYEEMLYRVNKSSSEATGANYARYATFVEQFVRRLQPLKVTPLIIVDGSFERKKLAEIRKRFDKRSASESFPVWCWHVARQVLLKHSIFHFTCIYEADEMIAMLAYKLNCPILSNDADFLLYDLPGGIIRLHFRNDDPSSPPDASFMDALFDLSPPLTCSIFTFERFRQIESLKEVDPLAIQLLGPIMGNDYFADGDASRVRGKIYDELGLQEMLSSNERIEAILNWLGRYRQLEPMKRQIRELCDEIVKKDFVSPTETIQAIRKSQRIFEQQISQFVPLDYQELAESVDLPDDLSQLTAEQFYSNNLKLFPDESQFPVSWMHQAFVEGQIDPCALTIYQHQWHLYPKLAVSNYRSDSMEDSFGWRHQNAKHEPVPCFFSSGLAAKIYGLLRRQKTNSKLQVVTTTYRKQPQISPSIDVPMLKVLKWSFNDDDEAERMELFTRLIGLNIQNLWEKIIKIRSLRQQTSQQILLQLMTMLLALQYFRQFPPVNVIHLPATWSAFIRALLVNILIVGQLPNDANVLSLEAPLKTTFLKAPKKDTTVDIKICKLLFTEYQHCLQYCIILPAQLLRLTSFINVDQLICGLEGTFIYKLTNDLANIEATKGHKKRLLEIFESDKMAKVTQKLVELTKPPQGDG